MSSRLFRGRSPPPLPIALACLAILLLSISFLHSAILWPQLVVKPLEDVQSPDTISPESSLANHSATCSPALKNTVEEWAPSRFLKGSPTQKFKDNLLDDAHYITTFSNAGLTNQFQIYVNMIYLGFLSDRIPIIPPFVPDHHISYRAGALPFGRVFNLSRAREALRVPLLEWHEVKAIDAISVEPPHPSEREQLGCWSTRPETEANALRVPSIVDNLRFDVAYTRIPMESRRDLSSHTTDNFAGFSHIVPYIYPNDPIHHSGHFPLMDSSPLGHRLPPNEQLSCFDQLYYVTSSMERFEWRFSWSPAWRFVAKHLYFTDGLYDLANAYLARAFKTTEDHLPPFIAVHMRRGDFIRQCHDGRPEDQCLIPLSKFHKEVDRIRDEIRKKKKIDVKHVIVMSDDEDPGFWKEVESIGWVRLDHFKELTLEKYGEWIPPILDQVAQSMAVGFVGTEDSTFSLVSMRRIQDWNDGPGVLITRDPYRGT